jgi:hypothetical protein
MKVLWFFTKLICCLAICAGLAGADSLQLRNGRHLQGKYIGGTTSAIGFMTAGSVEYFATSDVLVLIFENNDSPMSGLQPNPMKGNSLAQPRVRQISASTRDRIRQPRLRATTLRVSSDAKLEGAKVEQKITQREPTPESSRADDPERGRRGAPDHLHR